MSIGTNFVWTGTNSIGLTTGNTCNNWSDSTDQFRGTAGLSSDTSETWTNRLLFDCDVEWNLYCFEQ